MMMMTILMRSTLPDYLPHCRITRINHFDNDDRDDDNGDFFDDDYWDFYDEYRDFHDNHDCFMIIIMHGVTFTINSMIFMNTISCLMNDNNNVNQDYLVHCRITRHNRGLDKGKNSIFFVANY